LAETLCPKCGFSPIPDRAETCPKCGENFAFHPLWKVAQRTKGGIDKKASIEMESTTFGGLTGEVSANPIPASVVTGLCAVVWLLRAGVAQTGDPAWLFVLAALQLGSAALLMANVGPATMLVQLMGLVQLIVPFVIMGAGTNGMIVAAASALPGVAVFITAAGEPGPVRRNAGIVIGAVTFLVAIGAVFGLKTEAPVEGEGVPAPTGLGGDEGWDIKAAGLERLQKGDVAPHLTVPAETQRERHSPFGNKQKGIFGLVSRNYGGVTDYAAGCEDWLKAIGNTIAVKKLGHAASMFGPESVVLELKTGSGASGKLACGLVQGTLWGVAVVATDPNGAVGNAEFDRIMQGFAIY
jgi:hypothetical protein